MGHGSDNRLNEALGAVGVLTLTKGRDAVLGNMLIGLERGTRKPDICVVTQLDPMPSPLPPLSYPIVARHMPSNDLPLASARNAAAERARTPILIFLDADCIPAANTVEVLAAAATADDALICCEVLYLPPASVGPEWREAHLRRVGRPHPARRFPEVGTRYESNSGLFWSLAFVVRRATFERIGGFDESYRGYGGEDTDLAYRARDAGVPLLFTGSTVVFHQHHPVYDPPLHHFAAIIQNSERFWHRHGFWPMQGWLDAFAAIGLIELPTMSGRLRILRSPTATEIGAAVCPDRVY